MDITYEQAKLVLSAINDAINMQNCRVLMCYDNDIECRQKARIKAEKFLGLRYDLEQKVKAIEDEAKRVLDEMLERDKE